MLPNFLENVNDSVTEPDACIVYLDEVGRGALAHCVCVAAVVWPSSYERFTEDDMKLVAMINDSKKVTPKRRALLSDFIKRKAIATSIACVSNEDIDKINILQATFQAMHAALDQLNMQIDRIVVDGPVFKQYANKCGDCSFVPHVCVVDGDSKLIQIAAASILAKVHRDGILTELVKNNPELQVYGWDKNKAYGTKAHFEAIRQYGLTPYHRKTFIHL